MRGWLMHNSQHARVLARFVWPTLGHAQDVSAEFGSLDNCSCFEKVTYPAEPDVDFAIHLELDEVRKGLSLRDGAGAEGAGKLSNRLAEALERDDHAVGMLWALLAGRDDAEWPWAASRGIVGRVCPQPASTVSHRSHPCGTGKIAVCTRRYRPRNWTSRCDTSPGRA